MNHSDNSDASVVDIDTLLHCVRSGGETGDLAAAEIKRRLDPAARIARHMGAIFEPRKYSAEWISQQIGQRSWLPVRDCSLCSVPIGYVVNGDTVWFRSDCGCSCYTTEDRLSSFDKIAEMLAMQYTDEHRDMLVARMLGRKEADDT